MAYNSDNSLWQMNTVDWVENNNNTNNNNNHHPHHPSNFNNYHSQPPPSNQSLQSPIMISSNNQINNNIHANNNVNNNNQNNNNIMEPSTLSNTTSSSTTTTNNNNTNSPSNVSTPIPNSSSSKVTHPEWGVIKEDEFHPLAHKHQRDLENLYQTNSILPDFYFWQANLGGYCMADMVQNIVVSADQVFVLVRKIVQGAPHPGRKRKSNSK